MLAGDFERAWRVTDAIEARAVVRGPHNLVWDGTPVDGRRVLVRCYHGLGDTLQFLRYIPLLRQRAAEVTVDLQPGIRTLFPEEPEGADPPPQGAVEIEVMELAYLFRTTLETIPRRVPYLDTARIARIPVPIAPRPGCNIGVVWAAGEWNPRRSLPLAAFAPLAQLPGVRLYSLQQGPRSGEARQVPFPVETPCLAEGNNAATAAAMLRMDLVISVDSMTAHLAGALGVPVWTLLRDQPDWRWMRDRDDSPWYPTMRLFRQRTPGDWPEVIRRVAAQLICR